MIDIQKIKELTTNSKIIEFAEFVISESGEKEFANYKELDAMKIPRLIPHFFVFDYRRGIDDGLLIHHSGTFMDSFFGENITGHYEEEYYKSASDKESLIDLYRTAYSSKKTAYACREIDFDINYKKFKHAESVVFQSSSDGEILDFGLGIAIYSEAVQNCVENGCRDNQGNCKGQYLLLD